MIFLVPTQGPEDLHDTLGLQLYLPYEGMIGPSWHLGPQPHLLLRFGTTGALGTVSPLSPCSTVATRSGPRDDPKDYSACHTQLA